ncbi:DUF6702 family protein [Fretibacter rubidus]|uniref:DUF6702 family protein n=1 Tax=Fretibacter rubidus TaxID=570162 RepID=UPI003529D8E6
MTFKNISAGALSRRQFAALSFALIGANAVPAAAHRERLTFSEIEWEDNPGFLYVTHSFHVHEAERTLYKAGVLSKPDLYSLKSRAELALYAAENFTLKTMDGTPITLELLGAEIVGRDCQVYQQADIDALPDGFAIDCRFMREFDHGQINNVDVKVTDRVQSLSFRGDDGVKTVQLST